MHEQLKAKIYEAVGDLEKEVLGIAFSGGLDSSLLSGICKQVGKNVTLLTVAFSRLRDIKISNEIAEALDLGILHDVVPLEELEHGLRTVLSIIEFERIARLENCLCFYYVFRLASKHGIHTVLSANGIDELFCGYHVYKNSYGDKDGIVDLMYTLVETARRDKEEVDKLSALFGVEYVCPFLSDGFVDFAMKIPVEFKIKSKDDDLRKHILREVALELGLPRSAALRPRKAFQYSSGMHKAITRLAKERGFKRKYARAVGFSGKMEAYINSLKRDVRLGQRKD
jgi:asparagine synthase (glutamine-hydrolysing)